MSEEVDGQHADVSPVVAQPSGRPLRKPAVWARALAAGLVVVLAVAGWLDMQIRRDADIRDQMLQAARGGLIALTSIDHQHADRDVQRILDVSTGSFRDDFEQRAAGFKDAARQAESTSVGTVNESAVESVDGDQGRVLVALTVMTSNRGVPERQPKSWRTRVTVFRTGDGFKLAAVEFVA